MPGIAVMSANDKTDLAELSKDLHDLDYEIVASGGTYAHIKTTLDLTRSLRTIDEYAAQEVLHHRHRVLGREESMGLLAGRIAGGREPNVKVVVCNFRPHRLEEGRIVRDVGGPNLVSASVLGNRCVVTNPSDYPELIKALKSDDAEALEAFRIGMDRKALAYVISYLKQVMEDQYTVRRFGSVPARLR